MLLRLLKNKKGKKEKKEKITFPNMIVWGIKIAWPVRV